MAVYDYSNIERAEAYRYIAELFLKAPEEEALNSIREEFGLDSEETEDVIRKEFDRLFTYPEGKLPPIESFFLTLDNRSSAEEVAEFYLSAGLTISEEFEVIPDHLYLELIFMSYLVETNRYDLQKKFLDEHLMNWVPYYCDELNRESRTSFYRELAEIIKEFLISESEEEIF